MTATAAEQALNNGRHRTVNPVRAHAVPKVRPDKRPGGSMPRAQPRPMVSISIDHWCETPTVAKVAQWSGQVMTVGTAAQWSQIDPMVIAWAQAQWSFFLPDKSVGHGPGTKWAQDGHEGPDVTKPALGGLC